MQIRVLGQSKLRVSAVGLGGMPLSIANRPNEKQAIEVLCAAFEAGINFVDTANVYCLNNSDLGHNERLIGKAIKIWGGNEKIFVATKGGLERPNGAWIRSGHPNKLRSACEASLKALGVETIDLYQLHAPDPKVPFSESLGALTRLKDEGKIRYIGLLGTMKSISAFSSSPPTLCCHRHHEEATQGEEGGDRLGGGNGRGEGSRATAPVHACVYDVVSSQHADAAVWGQHGRRKHQRV